MYGLIGKIIAVDGKRDELSSILLDGLRNMSGNLLYIVATDPENANNLWITEVWKDQASHERSLSLETVKKAIQKGRPLIAGMERIANTIPLGGKGL